MEIKTDHYSIYDLVRKWSLKRNAILLLIITNKLKASILQVDGSLLPYDKYTDVPDELRANLRIVNSKHVSIKEYKTVMSAWNQVFISTEEVDRFKLQTSNKEKSDLHPKIEKTLLTIIAYLLEVISGEFKNRDVLKHQSIKNQSDLITKFLDLEVTGLSKSNLEKYFSLATKTIKNPSEENG